MPFKDPSAAREYRKQWKRLNRDKVNAYQRGYFKRNPQKYPYTSRPKLTDEERLTRRRATKKRNRDQQYRRAKEYVQFLKEQGQCQRCPESDAACLTFHHRDASEKLDDISRILKRGLKKVKEEIVKCEMLCFNCHMKEHKRLREIAILGRPPAIP